MRAFIKVAPGVRLSASSRGLRASVGPRIARVHVGSGRPGVSTGAGPVTFYQSLGGSSAGRGSGTTQADKQAAADAIRRQLRRIMAAPAEDVVALKAPRPVGIDSNSVDAQAIRARHERKSKLGVPVWAFSRRRLAATRAAEFADAEIKVRTQELREQAEKDHAEQVTRWDQLLANDPDTVLSQLKNAFGDNESPAAGVGVDGDRVLITVIVPSIDAVPERMPGVTPAGNLSLKKTTKTEQAGWHLRIVCGAMTYTAREAFAVCPGVEHVELVALRSEDGRWVALMAADVSRDGIRALSQPHDPLDLLDHADEVVLETTGRTGVLAPLPPNADASVAQVLAQLNNKTAGVLP